MQIKVLNRPVEKTQSTWDGKTSDRWQQWCVMEIDGLPTAFTVSHMSEATVHPPGDYEIDQKSFSVSNGRLTMNRCVLKPVASASRLAPKAG